MTEHTTPIPPQHTDRRAWLAAMLRGAAACIAGVSDTALGLPAVAPALLLANVDGPHIDPRHYLVSEKYDGVRAYWDGRRLCSRSGRNLSAPVMSQEMV